MIYWIGNSVDYRKVSVLILAMVIISSCLSSRVPETNTSVTTVYEWSACEGWDDQGIPVGFSEVISVNAKSITACGRLEKDYSGPFYLTINWYYLSGSDNPKRVHREIVKVEADGYFYSVFHPSDMAERAPEFAPLKSFLPGHYIIDVVFGKTIVRTTKFQVE